MQNGIEQSTASTVQERVAIVGAGPTGLLAANLLGQAGIPTLLIERQATPGNEPRAITIDDEGLRILHAIGLADELSTHALLGRAAHYVSHQRFLAQITPHQQPNGYPLISTFHQPILEQILLAGIKRYPEVTPMFEQTVQEIKQTDQYVELLVWASDGTTQSIRSSFVLACDGASSRIRQSLDIQLRTCVPRSQGERWLVCDTVEQKDQEHSDEPIIFFCDPHRPAVTVPAPGQRRRWEFMLKTGEASSMLNMHETIRSLIQQASASLPPGQTLPYAVQARIERSKIYTFHTLNASSYKQGRTFLLGDAAHQMPPFGGQGMNSGLRDAYNLYWKISAVQKKQASSDILNSYQQERQPHTTRMILFSATLGALIMTTHSLLATLRDRFFQLVQHVRPLQSYLADMRIKPTARYPHGLLLPRHLTRAHQLTGTLFPFCMTKNRQSTPPTLCSLDTLQQQHFLLLWRHSDSSSILPRLTGTIWQQLDVRFLSVLDAVDDKTTSMTIQGAEEMQTGEQTGIVWSTISDESGHLIRLLLRNKGCLLLLRPDQYVMGIFTAHNIGNVEQALATLFGVTEDRQASRK